MIWIGTWNGEVLSFKLETGEPVDRFALGSEAAHILVHGGEIFAAIDRGQLFKLASGAVPQSIEVPGGVRGGCVALGPRIAVATQAQKIAVFSTAGALEQLWPVDTLGLGMIASRGDRLLVSTFEGFLRCLDAQGSELWRKRTGRGTATAAAFADGTWGVLVPEVGVFWIDDASGQQLGVEAAEVRSISSDGQRFFLGDARQLTAFSKDGRALFRFPIRDPGAATGADGQFVVGSRGGVVYGFRTR